MLGEPLSMLVPQVVGFRLTGELPEGATATDLVLTVTEILRQTGVVGKFVEYFGHGLAALPLADRATIGNMSPEYGATCGFFPVDEQTLDVPPPDRPQRRADRARRGVLQGEHALARARARQPTYSQVVELDLSTVEPSLAGPRRPQDRVPLAHAKTAFLDSLGTFGDRRDRLNERQLGQGRRGHVPGERPDDGAGARRRPEPEPDSVPVAVADPAPPSRRRRGHRLRDRARQRRDRGDHVLHEHVEPAGDGRRRPAREEGGRARPERKPWVKSSLAPGSKVVTEYYDQRRPDAVPRAARLPHRRLRLHDVHRQLRARCRRRSRGRRRGRPRRLRRALGQPQLRGADPPRGEGELPRLAAARRRLRARRPDGPRPARRSRSAQDQRRRRRLPRATSGRPRPRSRRRSRASVRGEMFRDTYADVFTGDDAVARAAGAGGRAVRLGAGLDLRAPAAVLRRDAARARQPFEDIAGARCLVWLGDSVTTDHISPAGSIKPDSPAGGVPRRARRRAEGLQLLRLAPRQPRGDGARHVRERPPAQPARARLRGHVDGAPAVRRGDDDLRRVAALPRRGHADDRARRQGVRLRLVARLGGEGPEPARRQGRDRRELRADPPLEPADDGDPAAAVPARREPRVRSASPAARSSRSRASRTARRAR